MTSRPASFIKTTALAFAISIAPVFGTISTAQAAGIQSQMDKLFGDMSNVTAPGAYKTQRRGVLTAGRITQKSKIFQENLVSFSPPSWKAGCGGVDMYGGALSFISKEQIVALMRAVAANAKGYFFQLALSNTCPDCATWIETFQKKIQELNQFLGNSCQLAQGLVNDMSNLLPFDVKHKTEASLAATAKGLMPDYFETRQQNDGKSATKTVQQKNPAKMKEMTGNITWKQLKENNASNWFTLGDNALLEAIMSLTGSVIIGEPVDDDSGDDSTPIHFVIGNQVTLEQLMHGGQVQVYDCSGDTTQCAGTAGVLNKKTVTLKGIKGMIDDILIGTPSTPGLINKHVNHRDYGGLTTEEQAFLETLPNGVGGIIRQLSTLSPDAAVIFSTESSNALALNMVYHIVENLFQSANIALANSKSNFKTQAIEKLNSSQRKMQNEYAVLSSMHGDISSLIARYNNLIENVRKQQYVLQSLTKPAQKGSN